MTIRARSLLALPPDLRWLSVVRPAEARLSTGMAGWLTVRERVAGASCYTTKMALTPRRTGCHASLKHIPRHRYGTHMTVSSPPGSIRPVRYALVEDRGQQVDALVESDPETGSDLETYTHAGIIHAFVYMTLTGSTVSRSIGYGGYEGGRDTDVETIHARGNIEPRGGGQTTFSLFGSPESTTAFDVQIAALPGGRLEYLDFVANCRGVDVNAAIGRLPDENAAFFWLSVWEADPAHQEAEAFYLNLCLPPSHYNAVKDAVRTPGATVHIFPSFRGLPGVFGPRDVEMVSALGTLNWQSFKILRSASVVSGSPPDREANILGPVGVVGTRFGIEIHVPSATAPEPDTRPASQ